MKTEKEIDKDILALLVRIKTEFPELVKYLPEMPVRIFNDSGFGVNIESLADYYNSLAKLIEMYAQEQTEMSNNQHGWRSPAFGISRG